MYIMNLDVLYQKAVARQLKLLKETIKNSTSVEELEAAKRSIITLQKELAKAEEKARQEQEEREKLQAELPLFDLKSLHIGGNNELTGPETEKDNNQE